MTMTMTGTELAEYLRMAAIWAPSAMNRLSCTPIWRDATTFDLELPSGWQALPQARRFLAEMSMGAMVENVRWAAMEVGREVGVEVCSPASPNRVSLRLDGRGSASLAPVEAAGVITRRCTNRRPYDPRPLASELVDRLLREAADGTVVADLLDAGARRCFAQAAALADASRLGVRSLHDEMYAEIRCDAGWTQSVDQGIPLGSLELGPLLRPGFTAMRHWPLCWLLAPAGAAALCGWRSGSYLARRAGAIFVLSADPAVPDSALCVGRAMQRVWLRATALGLAVQPMPASALFLLPWWSGVPCAVRQHLAGLWQEMLPGRTPLMVLRIGWAPPPTVRALRPLAAAASPNARVEVTSA